MQPLVIIDAVGLTPRWVSARDTPSLHELAAAGGLSPLTGGFPALTCPVQASLLTGTSPAAHGIVANGWFERESGEVRFWSQSARWLRAEPFYGAVRRAGGRVAKLFWWFNQGADVDIALTPKPHYGADGRKVFDILSTPAPLARELEAELGRFPFHRFWGPLAGGEVTRWIARAAARVLERERPDLTLVYLPHLDYDLQRLGPSGADRPALLAELDASVGIVAQAARARGAAILVVSEYGLADVSRAVLPNRALRAAGMLSVRDGPFGEMLDVFASRAFAVVDHQVAQVYVQSPADVAAVRQLLLGLEGAERALEPLHERGGEFQLLAAPGAWFAYPWWLDDARAPDYARTVDIHRKPGYDPLELFFDPALVWPRLRVLRRLLARSLGFRNLMDVVPLNPADPALVRGSHGQLPDDPLDGAVVISDRRALPREGLPVTELRALALDLMEI